MNQQLTFFHLFKHLRCCNVTFHTTQQCLKFSDGIKEKDLLFSPFKGIESKSRYQSDKCSFKTCLHINAFQMIVQHSFYRSHGWLSFSLSPVVPRSSQWDSPMKLRSALTMLIGGSAGSHFTCDFSRVYQQSNY